VRLGFLAAFVGMLALACGARTGEYAHGDAGPGGQGGAGGGPAPCQPPGGRCDRPVDCCDGAPCLDGTCGDVVCKPDGVACTSDAECCGAVCGADAVCGPDPACSHDECTPGGPLAPSCSSCTELVCSVDPQCCMIQWSDACVAEAQGFCGIPCGQCQPDGVGCSSPEQCCSGVCGDGVCGGGCLPDGNLCMADFQCCSFVCGMGICGFSPGCSHDVCQVGDPLDPGCTMCTAQICAVDAFCCQSFWDDLCVDEVASVCGQMCGGCLPNGSVCMLDGDCCSMNCGPGNHCNGPMCTPDGGMCQVDGDCCNANCNGGICGPSCQPNGAMCMTPQECCSNLCFGGTCGNLCAPNGFPCLVDANCCNNDCQMGTCGGTCQPDGSICFAPADCCSMQCNGNVCGGNCVPDGNACNTPAECCSQQCSGGFCGQGPLCPSDGSPCGDCAAQNCCNEFLACLTAPGCPEDLQCYFPCLAMTGDPIGCFMQCIDQPESFQVIACLAGNCLGDCF
jgi:hypothetical protein